MEKVNAWEDFWKEWRKTKVETEEDLYFQVGKTFNKKPISKEIFDRVTENIIDILALNSNDVLVELCCGNGLCTYEFRDKVKQIIAVDFAPHLIEAAKEFKSAPNIEYRLGSVFDFLEEFTTNWTSIPSKYLMNDSLAYFTPMDLENILTHIINISGNNFTFLIRGVPNDLLKWNFYCTDEWKARYLENVKKGDTTNDGLGRWWTPAEIEQSCTSLNLKCEIHDQPVEISNFRMDIIISGSKVS